MRFSIHPLNMKSFATFMVAVLLCFAWTRLPADETATETLQRAGPVVVQDPQGNLHGDSERTWIDLTSITLSISSGTAILDVEVASPLPAASQMPGLSADLMLHLLSDSGQDPLDPALLQQLIRFNYSKEGWAPVSILDKDPSSVSLIPIRITSHGNSVSFQFPAGLIQEYSHWAVSTSTACAPKWRPLTHNPPTPAAALPEIDDDPN